MLRVYSFVSSRNASALVIFSPMVEGFFIRSILQMLEGDRQDASASHMSEVDQKRTKKHAAGNWKDFKTLFARASAAKQSPAKFTKSTSTDVCLRLQENGKKRRKHRDK